MKKILDLLVYRPNRWYDNLEEVTRFLFFLGAIVAPTTLFQMLMFNYDIWQPYVGFVVVFLIWRLLYLGRKKEKYVFDIETNGLYDTPSLIHAYKVKHDKMYDQEFIDNLNKSHREELERIGVAHDTSKPEIIDVLKLSEKISKKSKK